jgi:GMP synthase-like glutamine amidotransferase
MRRALVIQHVEMEGPARIAEILAESGVGLKVVAAFADPVPSELAPDELLLIMGGSMGVGDRADPRFPFLVREIALVERALRQGNPILGVCLGAQLLAHAAGARVFPNLGLRPDAEGRPEPVPVREVGWAPITLHGLGREPALAGLPEQMTVLHWHGDTFDLPSGAVHLASSAACRNQAFRLGERVFGLQFHVEVDGPTAARWALEDADFVRSARGPDGPAEVVAESARLATAALPAADRMIRNIVGCMGA